MVRKCSHLGPHHVQVALLVQLLVLEWMLDEHLCGAMEIGERPALAITALLSLRDLSDAQPGAFEPTSTVASNAFSQDVYLVSPPRQGILLWELPQTQPLPDGTQQRCQGVASIT